MTQYAVPSSDISKGAWLEQPEGGPPPGTLWDRLDSVPTDNDTSYVRNKVGGSNACEVKLSSVTDPLSSTDHLVHLYYRSIGDGDSELLSAYVYESTSLIATIVSGVSNRSGSYVDANYTLSTAEANSISDYSDLRIRLVAVSGLSGDDELRVADCWLEVGEVGATKNAAITCTLPAFTQILDVDVTVQCTASNSLPSVSQAAAVADSVMHVGTASQSLPLFLQSLAGEITVQADIAQSMPTFTQDADATRSSELAAVQSLPTFTQSASVGDVIELSPPPMVTAAGNVRF